MTDREPMTLEQVAETVQQLAIMHDLDWPHVADVREVAGFLVGSGVSILHAFMPEGDRSVVIYVDNEKRVRAAVHAYETAPSIATFRGDIHEFPTPIDAARWLVERLKPQPTGGNET